MTILDLLKDKAPLEPETLTQLFPNLSVNEKEKIMVFGTILKTDFVHEDLDIFENAVQVLNGHTPNIKQMESVFPEWIWKALSFIKKLRPTKEFSHEVKEYIKFIFNDSGYIFYPENIGIDNPHINEIKKLALDGPFPLPETSLGIQAMRYLKIQEYLK